MTSEAVPLLSVVLELEPLAAAPVPAQGGRSVHGLLLALLHQHDPEEADVAHAEARVRPFTTSPLLDPRGRWVPTGHVAPGSRYLVRLTGYGVGVEWVRAALAALPEEVRLEEATFRVAAIHLPGGQHPLAQETTHLALVEAHLLGRQPPGRHLRLHFLTPTTFRSGGKNVPLPLPGLVVEGLLTRWNAVMPTPLPGEVRRYAEETVAVAAYRLHTVSLPWGNGRQVGFMGACRWVALNPDPYWLRQLHLLSTFAFYAGVGAKTAQGLGQVQGATGSV